jgi:hypothetical protein
MALSDCISSLIIGCRKMIWLPSQESFRKWNIQTFLRRPQSSVPEVLRETAWLDGVRGVAAFLVMNFHAHGWWVDRDTDAPFGANDDSWDIWRLPLLRLWFCSGYSQVNLFFILSGFVLVSQPARDYRPLGPFNERISPSPETLLHLLCLVDDFVAHDLEVSRTRHFWSFQRISNKAGVGNKC